MLRVAGRRLSSLTSSPATWKSHQAAASTIASPNFVNREDSSSSSYSNDLRSAAAAFRALPMFHLPSRGFASDSSLTPKSEDKNSSCLFYLVNLIGPNLEYAGDSIGNITVFKIDQELYQISQKTYTILFLASHGSFSMAKRYFYTGVIPFAAMVAAI